MLKYAIIGCGRIAPNHIVAAMKANMVIVALCDLNTTKATQLACQFNLENYKVFSNYRDMINSVDLDVVSIATPSGLHSDIAVACCQKGINVIIEKPIALSICDAARISEVATKNGVVVTVCHQNRFNRAVNLAMQTVRQGKIGKVLSINANVLWNRKREYYEQAKWRGTWKQDGGVLMNQGIHNIDLLRWFAGSDVHSVAALIGNAMHPYIEVEDIGVAIIKFKNGCIGTINCTSNVYPSNLEETLYLIGEKGTIKLGGKSVNQIDVYDIQGIVDSQKIIEDNSCIPPNEYGYGHTPLYLDFVQSVEKHTKPFIEVEDAKKSLELVLGIYKSTIDKGFVEFPIIDFSTDNMGEVRCGL